MELHGMALAEGGQTVVNGFTVTNGEKEEARKKKT